LTHAHSNALDAGGGNADYKQLHSFRQWLAKADAEKDLLKGKLYPRPNHFRAGENRKTVKAATFGDREERQLSRLSLTD
jgi:hypothetical protein